MYTWDGSLISNTPMREVFLQSRSNNKNIFIIKNYSKKVNDISPDMTKIQARISRETPLWNQHILFSLNTDIPTRTVTAIINKGGDKAMKILQ